jgi:hypothetical protein
VRGEGTRTLEPPDCQSVNVPSGWWYSVPVSPAQMAIPLKSNDAQLCPVRLNVASMAINLATFSEPAEAEVLRREGVLGVAGGFIGIGHGLRRVHGW